MTARRFEDLKVWQCAADLAVAIHELADTPSFRRRPALRDQICRASASVMANIAEGFGRYRYNEFRRFLIIARGSSAEVQSHLHLAQRLRLLDASLHAALQARYTVLGRRISRLWSTMRQPPPSNDQ
jgi:four helix bundle protein